MESIRIAGIFKNLGDGREIPAVSCTTYQNNLSATDAYRDNRYSDAVKFATSALQENNNFSPAKNTLGMAYLELGKYEQAVPILIEAATLSPKVDFYTNVGIALIKQQKFPEAEEYLKKAKSMNINDPTSYYGFSLLYLEWLQENPSKIKNFQDSTNEFGLKLKWNIETDDDTSENLFLKGNYYKHIAKYFYNNAEYNAALTNFEKANDFTEELYEEILFFQAMSYIKINNNIAACNKWKKYHKIALDNYNNFFTDDFEANKRKSTAEQYIRNCQ